MLFNTLRRVIKEEIKKYLKEMNSLGRAIDRLDGAGKPTKARNDEQNNKGFRRNKHVE